MSIGSFFEHAFAPVTNVGNALIHGDILGGQYQASLPDYLKTAGIAAGAALPFVAGPALAGLGGEAAAAGAVPAATGAAAAETVDPLLSYAQFLPQAEDATYGATAASGFGTPFGLSAAPYSSIAGDLGATPAAGFFPSAAGEAAAVGAPATAGAPLSLAGAAAAPAAAAPWYAGIPGATTVANFASANPMLTAGLGIGGAALLGGQKLGGLLNPNLPYQQNLENVAGANQANFQQLSAEGQTLMQPELTGQLPPGWQALIDQNLNQIRAQYARLGLTGSTMEQQDLATAQTTGALSIAQQLANSGQTLISDATSSLGAEAGVYQNLMNARVAQDTATQQTLGSFAGALALAGGLSARNPATAATSSTSV
jgi:hypothetical protein